jgi:hypothetical protein
MAGLLLLIRPRRRDLRRSLTLLFTLGLSLAALSSLTGCGNDSSLHLAYRTAFCCYDFRADNHDYAHHPIAAFNVRRAQEIRALLILD